MNEIKKREKILKAQKLLRKEDLDRRKHWGVETKAQEYRDAVVDSIKLDQLEETLDSFNQENVVTENLFDNIASQIDFEDLFAEELNERLKEILIETFTQGSSRVLTVDGDSLDVSFDVKPERIIDQLQAQDIYLKNLSEDAEERVRDLIIQGSEEGKSIGEMKDDIVDGVEDMTEHRAETIARSETIKASTEGTDEAMKQAGIDRVVWDATIDDRTCETCRDLNGQEFDRESSPKPVGDTHPNCRCAILAVID